MTEPSVIRVGVGIRGKQGEQGIQGVQGPPGPVPANIITGNGSIAHVVGLTQAAYDALYNDGLIDPATLYAITEEVPLP